MANPIVELNGHEIKDKYARDTINQEIQDRKDAIENLTKDVEDKNKTLTDSMSDGLSQEVTDRNNAIKNASDNIKNYVNDTNSLLANDIEGVADTIAYVNVKNCGAVGDGATDDTEAILTALSSGVNIYFPEGDYVVTEPITISEHKHLFGDGVGKSIIRYNGTDYLFNITTHFSVRPTIEELQFNSNAQTNFMNINSGAWGSSVVLRNFRIIGFHGIIFNFVSSFACVVENGSVNSDGHTEFTTFDGTETTGNFNNCIYFSNVYFTRYYSSETYIPELFKLKHVRNITFNQCQLETATVLFTNTGSVQELCLENCWIERIGSIYKFDDQAELPMLHHCRIVTPQDLKYNGNATNIDYIKGAPYLYLRNGSTRTLNDLRDSEEVVLEHVESFNKNDSNYKYQDVYKISTHGANFNMPLNTYTKEAFDVTSLSMNLKSIAKYSTRSALYKIYVMIWYDDGSKSVLEQTVFSYRDVYHNCGGMKKIYTSTWGTGKTAVETISVNGDSSGAIVVSSDNNMKGCVIHIDYSFNNAKGW